MAPSKSAWVSRGPEGHILTSAKSCRKLSLQLGLMRARRAASVGVLCCLHLWQQRRETMNDDQNLNLCGGGVLVPRHIRVVSLPVLEMWWMASCCCCSADTASCRKKKNLPESRAAIISRLILWFASLGFSNVWMRCFSLFYLSVMVWTADCIKTGEIKKATFHYLLKFFLVIILLIGSFIAHWNNP